MDLFIIMRNRSRSRNNSPRNKDKNKTKSREDFQAERQRERERRRASKWSDGPGNFSSNTPRTGFNSEYPTKPTGYSVVQNVNPNILYSINDSSKIKRRIAIPKKSGVNFVGLLIGPKGTYQKRLEQQSGCKILIRGK